MPEIVGLRARPASAALSWMAGALSMGRSRGCAGIVRVGVCRMGATLRRFVILLASASDSEAAGDCPAMLIGRRPAPAFCVPPPASFLRRRRRACSARDGRSDVGIEDLAGDGDAGSATS